jgi:hypothetical protein
VISYGYVAHSNNIQKVGEVPTVRLAYDILPIIVQFSEKKQAFYHFVTNVGLSPLILSARPHPWCDSHCMRSDFFIMAMI